MQIQDTSIKTYHDIIEEGLLNRQEEIVARHIYENPNCTDKEISVNTGLNINAVTGRRNELSKSGVVESTGKRKCKITGREALQWHIKEKILFKRPDKNVLGEKEFKNLLGKFEDASIKQLDQVIGRAMAIRENRKCIGDSVKQKTLFDT